MKGLFLLLALVVSGCVAPTPTGPAPLAAAGQPSGLLYLFNVSGWTMIPSNQEIVDNGQLVASLPRMTYTRLVVVPGHHELRLHGRTLPLTVVEGRTHYVALGYRPERSMALPLAGDPVFLKEISEEEARPLLKDLKQEEPRGGR